MTVDADKARALAAYMRVYLISHDHVREAADTIADLLDEVEIQQRVIDEANLVVAKVTAERDAMAAQINVLLEMQRGDAEMIGELRSEHERAGPNESNQHEHSS